MRNAQGKKQKLQFYAIVNYFEFYKKKQKKKSKLQQKKKYKRTQYLFFVFSIILYMTKSGKKPRRASTGGAHTKNHSTNVERCLSQWKIRFGDAK